MYNHITGKTDRIDLAIFYPFLGVLAEVAHTHPDKPLHQGVAHVIVNSPNPRQRSSILPDGSAAKLILLGDPISRSEFNIKTWWPSADSDMVRSKLFRRIWREGYVIPIVTAIAVSLLTEMYTTTYIPASASPDGKAKHRIRLQHRKSPLTDFGIAKGVADVKQQDKLVYGSIRDRKWFMKGQDPNDHYWLYFTTLNGEEMTLELNMYTFNFCILILSRPYCMDIFPSFPAVPAFFRDREYAESSPDLVEERQRFSVLHNSTLHKVASDPAESLDKSNVKLILEFMDTLAGRKCTEDERRLLEIILKPFRIGFRHVIATQAWSKWPRTPEMSIEDDPEDPGCFVDDDEKWGQYHEEWKRIATKEEQAELYRKWEGIKHTESGGRSQSFGR